jgi:hypothetical protein
MPEALIIPLSMKDSFTRARYLLNQEYPLCIGVVDTIGLPLRYTETEEVIHWFLTDKASFPKAYLGHSGKEDHGEGFVEGFVENLRGPTVFLPDYGGWHPTVTPHSPWGITFRLKRDTGEQLDSNMGYGVYRLIQGQKLSRGMDLS